VKIVRY